jgi:hypothetical protein
MLTQPIIISVKLIIKITKNNGKNFFFAKKIDVLIDFQTDFSSRIASYGATNINNKKINPGTIKRSTPKDVTNEKHTPKTNNENALVIKT